MTKPEILQKMLFKKLNHHCDVWYENHRNGGWMFKSEILLQQRLGWNFKQAKEFISKYNWTWVKERLNPPDTEEEK